MIATQRDHLNAVNWIEGDIENMILELGKPNASAAAASCVTLAFMLRAIDRRGTGGHDDRHPRR